MRKRITIKGVEIEAVEMIAEIRDLEQRFAGAILSDAIRMYHEAVFDYDDDETPEAGHQIGLVA